jgi:hypothetical protein
MGDLAVVCCDAMKVTDLAEVHRLDTLATQRGTDGGAGGGLAGAHDELDDLVSCDLRHCGGWCGLRVSASWRREAVLDAKASSIFGDRGTTMHQPHTESVHIGP